MFELSPQRHRGPAGARGWRAYAVGDIHGRLDMLDLLLEQIHRDLERRPARKVLLVFVGDLIDRGPSSAQVIERLRTYARDGVRTTFLPARSCSCAAASRAVSSASWRTTWMSSPARCA